MKVHKLSDAFHNLIKIVRTYPELSDVRFVRRYGTLPAENPVRGYLAACGISEMKSAPRFLGADSPSDLMLCALTAAIDFYVPFGTKSADEERKTAQICEGILRADDRSLVTSVEVKDGAFESDISAVSRRILVKMEAYVSGEDEL